MERPLEGVTQPVTRFCLRPWTREEGAPATTVALCCVGSLESVEKCVWDHFFALFLLQVFCCLC